MLMSAANGSIRTVVKNVDDYLLAPIGRAFFAFNMQFDFDETIRGDLEVKANGTESLMANEVRSQRLMQFLQVASNPMLAPFAKMDYIVREIAKSQQPMQPPQGAMPPETGGPAPAGADAQDQTGAGGGTIGTGVAPAPGEQGFSGNVA
jgi:hypothetical protein